MNPQYEVAMVRDFVFEREDMAVRGTQFRCTICKSASKQLRLKGVYDELSAPERAKMKRRMNAMHYRHKKTCRPIEEAPHSLTVHCHGNICAEMAGADIGRNAGNGDCDCDGGGGGNTNRDVGRECTEEKSGREGRVHESGEGGEGCGDDDGGSPCDDELFILPELDIPEPLNPKAIASWDSVSVHRSLQHYKSLPAIITSMRIIPHGFGNPFVRCHLQNPHGTKVLNISSASIYRAPDLQDQYLSAEEQMRREQCGEHAALLSMFEQAWSANPAALRSALDGILRYV